MTHADKGGVELVILVGLQGAGKTTFCSKRIESSHLRLSKDDWPNNRRPQRRLIREIRAALESGRCIVADGTHPKRSVRAELIEVGREFDARLICFYFRSVVEECLERNSRRTGRARVPEVALFSTIKCLEKPSYGEGFEAIYHVRVLEGGGFAVSPWDDDEK